jgi:hypothetical protein
MVRPASAPPALEQRRLGAWLWLGPLVAVAMTFVWVRFHRTGSNSPDQPERTATQLVRQADRLCDKEGGRPFTGWLVERYSDSVVKSRSWLSNGVLHGLSEGWYTNGTLQVREQFASGVSEGTVTRWREDGSKLSEGTAHNGKLEGLFRRWHPTGQLAEEVPFHAGVPDGLSHAWHPDGSLKAEVRHINGTLGDRHYWKPGDKDGHVLAVQGIPDP